ncbi:MAG: hypothetical protein HAW59_03260 [Betaproteobacteria bacterium]|nr:hypothetical protein [Betaproteobacteria bacterium]
MMARVCGERRRDAAGMRSHAGAWKRESRGAAGNLRAEICRLPLFQSCESRIKVSLTLPKLPPLPDSGFRRNEKTSDSGFRRNGEYLFFPPTLGAIILLLRCHSRVGGNPKCGRKGVVFNGISPKISTSLGFSISPIINILDSRLRGNDSVGRE